MQQCRRPAGRVNLAQQVVLGVALAGLRAAVQDGRLVQLACQAQVTAQVGELVGARREATVVVEARLADGDDRRVAREIGDLPGSRDRCRARRAGGCPRRRRAQIARTTSSAARDDERSQPGTSMRSTPASRAALITSDRSARTPPPGRGRASRSVANSMHERTSPSWAGSRTGRSGCLRCRRSRRTSPGRGSPILGSTILPPS